MTKFLMEIALDNDAMQTPSDVNNAVGVWVQKGAINGLFGELVVGDAGPIMDKNGNTVGRWYVEVDS